MTFSKLDKIPGISKQLSNSRTFLGGPEISGPCKNPILNKNYVHGI